MLQKSDAFCTKLEPTKVITDGFLAKIVVSKIVCIH